jgi:hypothetical protein
VFDDASAAASALCDVEGSSVVKLGTCEKGRSRLGGECVTQKQSDKLNSTRGTGLWTRLAQRSSNDSRGLL